MPKKELKTDFIELYKIFTDLETKFILMHQDKVKFFIGIISALTAATITGLYKSELWQHFALTIFGPILIILICFISKKSVLRPYQRFLEAISAKAKIEQQLGMTQSLPTISEDDYWKNEPITAPRHLESRRGYDNSESWVKALSKKGYHQ